jgi:uncharacterized protein (TIGR02246 family)
METAAYTVTSADEVRALIEHWAKASRAKDIDGIMSCYAPDILAFDAVGDLQFKGAEAYKKHWEACLAMCPGPKTFEVHDLSITAGDDMAFGHYLGRCGGTDEKGEEKAGWFRVTVCCRKTNGQWRVVHEHFSAPFDPQSGKALLDLEPKHVGQTRPV